MNIAESNAMEALLKGAFWAQADSGEDADLVIINTCSVRKSAENRIWGRLGYYKSLKAKKKVFLVLTGCMANRIGEEIKRENPFVDLVLPSNDKLKILEAVGTGDEGAAEACSEVADTVKADKGTAEHTTDRGWKTDIPKSESYTFTTSYYKDGDYASFVPIMNGCNNFCSYCIVPYVRGREISRSMDDILREVSFLDSKNVREITLLGQNVNSYNYNGVKFPELLKNIADSCENIEWIRFESPHPKDFSDELISVIKSENRVAKHLHIPMQSGSTSVLQRMNRRYTKEGYLELIRKIKSEIPEMTFAVDVMTGFPGESEADFEETLDVMKEVGYIEAYMYYYNPREGTRSVTMDGQIPDAEKQRRLAVLIEKQLRWAAEIKAKRTGGVHKTLITGISRDNAGEFLGRNEHNEMVAFTPKVPIGADSDALSGAKNDAYVTNGGDLSGAGSVCSPGSALSNADSRIGTFANVEFMYLNGNTFVGREV